MADAATVIRREIDLGDGSGKQVFEGATEAELNDKLATAQEHGTRKIREQAQELETMKGRLAQLEAASAETTTTTTTNGFDKEGYFSTMYQDPLKAVDIWAEQRFGLPIDKLVERFSAHDRAADMVTVNQVAGQFARKHPELLQVTPDQDLSNSKAIDAIMQENEWKYSENNLEAAFLLAQKRGKIILPSTTSTTQEEVTATIGSQGGGASTEIDDATATANMSLDQKRDYYRAKIARAQAAAR